MPTPRARALREARDLLRREESENLRRLKAAEQKHRAALKRAEATQEARDQIIVEAVENGMAQSVAAKVIGTTPGRVWQIVQKAQKEVPARPGTSGDTTTHGGPHEQQGQR